MNKTLTATLLALTAVAMTGCGQRPQRLDGMAAPLGAPIAASPTTASVAPSPSISPSISPSVSPSPSKSPKPRRTTEPVYLGPDSYGAVKMGMTRAEAQAAGLIKGYETVDFGYVKCGWAKLKSNGAQVYFTPEQGLTNIYAEKDMRTPEGIRLGSTLKAVKAAYPDYGSLHGSETDDTLFVDLPGFTGYTIDIRKGKVVTLSLTHENQRCME